ncbi:endonuclease/exonuclease/phosphatase family protein [Medicago truncatula]|uniref:Endonuclease/exonuclease/phosphatase family protein n=1 Tax=Medicago truncatula TaxID=3880 RepID=A0A072TGK0_MEDTR|nr:endonuclease/exonuclease/phosphatase family protein [Medicago truncatula]
MDVHRVLQLSRNWQKKRFLEFIRGLARQKNLPWCLMGDFNDILHADEKKGRATRPNWLIRGFRKATQATGLIDVPMEGYPFTWFKSLGTVRAVEEKLNRAMATNSWMQLFPNAKLENLVAPSSDPFSYLTRQNSGSSGS